MCAMSRLAFVGLMILATTRRCGRPRWETKVDKRPEAA
jgi:hypothetical protein